MREFIHRHRLPLLVWAVLAGVTVWLGFVAAISLKPHPPLADWTMFVIGTALSWGLVMAIWIAGQELIWRSERRHASRMQQLRHAQPSRD